MITASEAGVTIKQGLLWTMVVGFLGLGVAAGKEITTAKSSITAVKESISQVDGRVRRLEDNLAESLTVLKDGINKEAEYRVRLTDRVRSTELLQARQDERLGLILSELNKLGEKMDQLVER